MTCSIEAQILSASDLNRQGKQSVVEFIRFVERTIKRIPGVEIHSVDIAKLLKRVHRHSDSLLETGSREHLATTCGCKDGSIFRKYGLYDCCPKLHIVRDLTVFQTDIASINRGTCDLTIKVGNQSIGEHFIKVGILCSRFQI